MLNLFIGYDTIMVNEFLKYGKHSGYLYSYALDSIYHLSAVPSDESSSRYEEDRYEQEEGSTIATATEASSGTFTLDRVTVIIGRVQSKYIAKLALN